MTNDKPEWLKRLSTEDQQRIQQLAHDWGIPLREALRMHNANNE